MISSLYLHFRASYRTYGRFKFNRFTVESLLLSITPVQFPDLWSDKHVGQADVDTPGNYPATSPRHRLLRLLLLLRYDHGISKQPGHQGRRFRDVTLNSEIC